MTVSELIAVLSRARPDAQVYLGHNDSSVWAAMSSSAHLGVIDNNGAVELTHENEPEAEHANVVLIWEEPSETTDIIMKSDSEEG